MRNPLVVLEEASILLRKAAKFKPQPKEQGGFDFNEPERAAARSLTTSRGAVLPSGGGKPKRDPNAAEGLTWSKHGHEVLSQDTHHGHYRIVDEGRMGATLRYMPKGGPITQLRSLISLDGAKRVASEHHAEQHRKALNRAIFSS